jgi:hypothetical protein
MKEAIFMMKCWAADKLSQYVDQMLDEKEMHEIDTHLINCSKCKAVVNAFEGEQFFIKETLQTPELPPNFTDLVLDQLEPIESKNVIRPKSSPWKKVTLTAAGLVLVVGLSTSLHSGFAEWLGGLFTTQQVDEGLRIAADTGFAQRVNQEVTDQGLTLKVEDVIADSSRIALSYQVLDKNGKPQDTYLDLGKAEIYATDQEGKRLDQVGMGWSEGSNYGLVEISLREKHQLNKLTITIALSELKGVKGNWELEIPLDITKSLNATKTIYLDHASTSIKGVEVEMKEARFAPSSTEIVYNTSFTKEELTTINEAIKGFEKKFGKKAVERLSKIYDTSIQYRIEDASNSTIASKNTFADHQGHTSDNGFIQSSGQNKNQMGHMLWMDSMIPQKKDSDIRLILDGVIKTVPSDFLIKIKPKDLAEKPVSFEYEGNYINIHKAEKFNEYSLEKSLTPINKETMFKIEMEGGKEQLAADPGDWIVVDNVGNVYQTSMSGTILDEKDENGRFKRTIELTTSEMKEIPEELTLHLLSVTRYLKADEHWEVKLK